VISLAKEVAIESPVSFVFFPMVVHDFDIVVSSIGILCVTEPGPTESDPMTTLQRGYSITFLLVLAGFGLSTRWLLFSSAAPGAWLHFFLCVIVGMASWAWTSENAPLRKQLSSAHLHQGLPSV
ncbi:hypothetical protein B5M09_012570, partial [Aphanomyces astaci]